MKKSTIILVSASLLAIASCENSREFLGGQESGEYIGLGQVEVDETTTKAGNLTESSTARIVDDEFDLTVTATVEPYMAQAKTKAGIVDRNALKTTGFYIDGWLGGEINSASGASAEDVKDHHFIKNELVKYDAGNTGEYEGKINGAEGLIDGEDYTGGWAFDPKTKYQWRNQINHYFWAYWPNVTFKSQDADNVSFDYTSDFESDLVLAHHQQYWEKGHCNHTNSSIANNYYDELKTLHFNHLLSAVSVNANISTSAADLNRAIVLRMVDKDGNYLYGDDFKTNDGKDVRGYINYIKLTSFTKGTYSATSDSQEWSGQTTFGDAMVYDETSATDKRENNFFIIPQNIAIAGSQNGYPTDATKNYAEIEINVKDNQLGPQYSRFFGFPTTLSSASEVEEWLAGNLYKYNYIGTFTFPYVQGDIRGLSFKFWDKPNKAGVAIKTLDLAHVKKVDISFDGLPVITGSNTYVYIGIQDPGMPYFDDNYPDTDEKHYKSDTIKKYYPSLQPSPLDNQAYSYIVFGAIASQKSFDKKDTYLELHDGAKVTINETTGHVSITGVDVTKITGLTGNTASVYIAYYGSNNSGSCTWVIDNFTMEIKEYR